jgi:protein-S-isoprenylcysteine O-methyltransferase Ste14
MILGWALSAILFLLIAVFLAMDFYFMFQFDPKRAAGKGWAWDYTLQVFAIGLAVILRPVLLPSWGAKLPSYWGLGLQGIGLLLVLGSFGLHIWARLHLRHFYAERVEVQAQHQLVDTGPYALVRHPVITSFFALALGLFLIDLSVITFVLVFYTFGDFLRAARQEEDLLQKTVPGYAEYMERTNRFLPKVWREK